MHNWNDLALFLYAYEQKTLTNTARLLNINQSTVGRRLDRLEQRLGKKLFIRSVEGLTPTPDAVRLIDIAKQMQSLATQFNHQSLPKIETVTISTTDALAHYGVLNAIKQLRVSHAYINIRLDVTTSLADLNSGEADIVLRTVRPTQQNYVVRKLATWEVGLYASKAYIQEYGMPNDGIHYWVKYKAGIIQASSLIEQANIEVNTTASLLNIIKEGLAIGEVPSFYAEQAQFIQVLPDQKRQQNYEVWLAYHQGLVKNSAVRAVLDAIIEQF